MVARIPLFPLGTVLFPGASLPLRIFEPRYRQLVRDLMDGPEPRTFGVVTIREGREVGVDGVRAMYDVGCVAEIGRVQESPDGRYALMTRGTWRFRVGELDQSAPYLQADVDPLEESVGELPPDLATTVRGLFLDFARAMTRTEIDGLELPEDPTPLSYAVAAALSNIHERQQLLEAPDTATRLSTERELLGREVALLRNLRFAPLTNPMQVPRSLN